MQLRISNLLIPCLKISFSKDQKALWSCKGICQRSLPTRRNHIYLLCLQCVSPTCRPNQCQKRMHQDLRFESIEVEIPTASCGTSALPSFQRKSMSGIGALAPASSWHVIRQSVPSVLPRKSYLSPTSLQCCAKVKGKRCAKASLKDMWIHN